MFEMFKYVKSTLRMLFLAGLGAVAGLPTMAETPLLVSVVHVQSAVQNDVFSLAGDIAARDAVGFVISDGRAHFIGVCARGGSRQQRTGTGPS